MPRRRRESWLTESHMVGNEFWLGSTLLPASGLHCCSQAYRVTGECFGIWLAFEQARSQPSVI